MSFPRRDFGNRASIRTSAAIAVLAPLILIVSTIRWSVDVPFWDEWDWADLVYHARTGTLTFAEIVAPHNEHRNTIPNIVFVLLDRFGSWHVFHEQLVSLAIIIGGQIVLWRLIRRTVPGARGAMTFAAMSFVVCGLGQWENFALGYNIGWNICTTAAIAVVALLSARRRTGWHVALAAAIAFAASFSSGQGLLLWPVGLLTIALVPRNARRSATAWMLAGVVVIALFYTDYHVVASGQGARLGDALPCVVYALTYLGSALRDGSGNVQATIGGVVLAAAFCIVTWADVAHRERSTMVRHAPWYAFALYALLGAAFTAAARVRMGLDSATANHYVAVALFLELAIVGLVASSWPRLRGSSRRNWRVALMAGAILAVGAEFHGMVAFKEYAADRRLEIDELQRGGPDLVRLAYPDPDHLAHLLAEMRAVHDVPYLRN